jgi:hypothetical protein
MSQPTESARATSRSKKKPTDQRQLIVTLNARDGDVIKVEELEKSGKRHEIMDEEFAALAGDEEAAGFFPALEHAYAAGFADADGEGFEFGEEDEDEGDIEQFLLHGVGAHPFLRHEVRKLILGRLVRRQLKRPARKRRGGKGHEMGHATEGEDQQAGREERKAKTKN